MQHEPKEYWVNVYSLEKGLGVFFPDKNSCVLFCSDKEPVLYRLHVKLKDNKPKYDPYSHHRLGLLKIIEKGTC